MKQLNLSQDSKMSNSNMITGKPTRRKNKDPNRPTGADGKLVDSNAIVNGRKPKIKPNAIVEYVAQQAQDTPGLLPHQFLLMVTRGEAIPHRYPVVKYDTNGLEVSRYDAFEMVYPTLEQRIECARICAPYYAPKLVISANASDDSTIEVLKYLAENLPS